MFQVITIDGPAASGKSSVSRELARRLGWQWVSTGAFYRGLAYVALQLHTELDDVEGLRRLALSDVWSVELDAQNTKVFLHGKDVTEQIHHEDVGSFASRVSKIPEVRDALLESQRNLANKGNVVAEGRDCGTIVFPSAAAKIYLTASSEHRAARRAAEKGADKDEIILQQKERDRQDSTRKAAPLQIPDGAFVVDSTDLNLDQVVDQIQEFIQNKF